MDFIDSLVLENATKPSKKAHRVRSWLLCEQYYKYLEKSQWDAAFNQPKFYQDTILERELSERRARRKSCDAGLCSSEGRELHLCSTTISGDDFECLQDDDSEVEVELSQHVDSTDFDLNLEDTVIEEDKDSYTSKASRSYARSSDDVTEDAEYALDAESVLDAAESALHATESVPADRERELKEKLEEITNNIMEDIKLQMNGDDFMYTEPEIQEGDEESLASVEHCMKQCKELSSLYDTSMQGIWSKVVSFAYQLIQLNHGNSYYEYSSQFLTAVLAFDVIRRGFNKMCE